MAENQSLQEGDDSSHPNESSTDEPICTAFEVQDDFNHYVEIPFTSFGRHKISPTSVISHLASLSLEAKHKDKWTGALSMPASEAVEAAKIYLDQLKPDSDTPSMAGWTLAIDPLTSLSTQRQSDGQLCRISVTRDLPGGSRIEGRFAWDYDRRSVYLRFRLPGVAFTDVLPDTSTMAPVKSIRTYLKATLVDTILEAYKKDHPEWEVSGPASTLPKGAIRGCIL
jgi:hypothetical protein